MVRRSRSDGIRDRVAVRFRLTRRRIVITAGVLALLVAAVGIARIAGLLQDLRQAEADLAHAVDIAETERFSITMAQAQEVAGLLASADVSLARAGAELDGDPLLGLFGSLPVTGRQLAAADTIVRAARELTRRHEEVNGLLTGFIAARDSGSGAGRIAALARFLVAGRPEIDALLGGFEAADGLVSGLPPDGLAGPIASVRSQLIARLGQARPLVAGTRVAETVVPSILGVGGARRYLVVALDNAEIRPVGGLIVAYGTPTFTDGRLDDFAFRDIAVVDRPNQKIYVRPPEQLIDHLLGTSTWQVNGAGWWPDFAISAAEIRRLFQLETGDADFQGVVAFTPELVDRLLEVVGPVTVPEAGITVHPGETYLLSLEQAEVLHEGAGRKEFLAALGSTVLERLLALPPERYLDVLGTLDQAARRRQLQVLFDDSQVQSAFTDLGWYRPFTFPAQGDRLAVVEANVGPASKLDVLLRMEHDLSVVLEPDGSAQEQLASTYTNQYGPALPPLLERVRSTFFSGNLGSYQQRFLDPRATALSVVSGAGSAPVTVTGQIAQEAGSLTVGNYQLVKPGMFRLETRYIVPGLLTSSDGQAASPGTYALTFLKQAGRDGDGLIVRVTVPPATVPTSWSVGGVRDGSTVTFATTTEFDRTFEVSYAPP